MKKLLFLGSFLVFACFSFAAVGSVKVEMAETLTVKYDLTDVDHDLISSDAQVLKPVFVESKTGSFSSISSLPEVVFLTRAEALRRRLKSKTGYLNIGRISDTTGLYRTLTKAGFKPILFQLPARHTKNKPIPVL